jgi:hypothetical protein
MGHSRYELQETIPEYFPDEPVEPGTGETPDIESTPEEEMIPQDEPSDKPAPEPSVI